MAQTVREPTDLEIRQAIENTLRQGLIDYHGATLGNEIIIHNHWVWGFSFSESAAALKILSGTEKGKIHGWLIGLDNVSRTRPQSDGSREGFRRLKNMNPNRRDIARGYKIWSFHQYYVGDAGNESQTNSETQMVLEFEAVADKFSKTIDLGIDNPWFLGHEELQAPLVDVFDVDSALVNAAQGTLVVRLQKPLDLNQY
jgi:hypothetical protein